MVTILPQQLIVAAWISLLARRAFGIKCYRSSGDYVIRSAPESCDKWMISCHEFFYELKGAGRLVYKAGCGGYLMSRKETSDMDKGLINAGNAECFSNGCNRKLLTELESTNRICHKAYRDKRFTDRGMICSRNVTKCYIDYMTGASEPLYFAGCGDCPSHTLYCYTCSTGNYCNATAETSRRVVYADDLVGPQSSEGGAVQQDEARARDASGAVSCRAVYAAVTLAAFTRTVLFALA